MKSTHFQPTYNPKTKKWSYHATNKEPLIKGGGHKTIYDCPRTFNSHEDASIHFYQRFWDSMATINNPFTC